MSYYSERWGWRGAKARAQWSECNDFECTESSEKSFVIALRNWCWKVWGRQNDLQDCHWINYLKWKCSKQNQFGEKTYEVTKRQALDSSQNRSDKHQKTFETVADQAAKRIKDELQKTANSDNYVFCSGLQCFLMLPCRSDAFLMKKILKKMSCNSKYKYTEP